MRTIPIFLLICFCNRTLSPVAAQSCSFNWDVSISNPGMVYIGGRLDAAGGQATHNIARWKCPE